MNEWEWRLLEERGPLEFVNVGGVEIKPGDRVRLRPRAGGDVFDIALAAALRLLKPSSRITKTTSNSR